MPEGPGSVGGPMRCPWCLFHRLFLVWARTQGPHDPLLPGGPMSCQSTPGLYGTGFVHRGKAMLQPSPKCCHKLGSTQLSNMSFTLH
ncbi:unnamed protein product [Staurois parvus]|uniref:Uncharacterized protein n=1 Tax=Staurois parvus TaxID=386267 RepID=A0ABN9ASG2_9NEOB|nr:unnamed protein product [Staurois parvus]